MQPPPRKLLRGLPTHKSPPSGRSLRPNEKNAEKRTFFSASYSGRRYKTGRRKTRRPVLISIPPPAFVPYGTNNLAGSGSRPERYSSSLRWSLLYVNGMYLLLALHHRRFGKVLAATELLKNSRPFVFTFELLEGPLDVFTLLDRHDNHCRNYFWLLKFGCMSLRTPSASAAVPEPPARPVPHRGTVPK